MLQPVMIVPSVASSAAPTLNPEKSAAACSRAPRAAATSASELPNDPLQEGDELAPDLPCGRHHFVMMQRFGKYARGRVADARDTEHFHSHVPRHDGLR